MKNLIIILCAFLSLGGITMSSPVHPVQEIRDEILNLAMDWNLATYSNCGAKIKHIRHLVWLLEGKKKEMVGSLIFPSLDKMREIGYDSSRLYETRSLLLDAYSLLDNYLINGAGLRASSVPVKER